MLQSGLFPEGADHTVSESPAGCFTFGNENDVRCNAGKAVLGTVDLPSALTVSSDVYFYSVGNSFWNAYRDEGKAAGKTGDLAGDDIPDAQHPVGNALQHTARTYGFGESTGMGIGDQSGVIPDHEYRVKLNPNDPELQFWRRGDSASLAVGQGDVLVTPLQLANAYAAFANGGTLYTPATCRRGDPEQRRAPEGQARSTSCSPLDPRWSRDRPAHARGPQAPILERASPAWSNPTARAPRRGVRQLPGPAGDREDRHRAGRQKASRTPRGSPASPTRRTIRRCRSTWSWRWSSRAASVPDVAAPIVRRVIDYLDNPAVPAPVVVGAATGHGGRATDVD